MKMTEIKIEKGVPFIPRIRPRKYPFNDMKIGDSFFIAVTGDSDVRKARNLIASSLRACAKRAGNEYRVTIRRVKGGLRCWRIK